MAKKVNILLVLALAASMLCGCSMQTVSDLYCLPKRSEEYTNLQSVMQSAMVGMEFSAPLAGENQQTMQAVDLDGDREPEYLLFAKDGSDKPLHIFVFAGDGETYELRGTIESTGSAFDQVEYIQMDDRPGYEIVVGRQVSDQVARTVSVYSLIDGQIEQIMTASYTQFLTCDLDRNGRSELFLLRPGDTGKGVAVLYAVKNRTLERSQEVNMSEPAENIRRIMLGKLQGGSPAVYVASAVTGSDGIITDVYMLQKGVLCNVSFSNESGTSVQTLRNYYIYADDIDGDGILELPSLITMKSTEEVPGAASQYIIRWYAMAADGSEVDKLYTYHNFTGGWYLVVDGELASRLTVSQMGSSFEFSLWDEEFTQTEKLMTLYALTGQKREEQAVADNRFVLSRSESTIYAANLEVASATYGMTKESLIGCFHLIQEDWKTGET